MTPRFRVGMVGSLTLAAGIATNGCPATTKCSAIPCPDQETCDPADGLCKCGGSQGVVCAPNETCDATRQACLPNLCYSKTCSGGATCDPQDGLCKCSGVICTCGEQACDPISHSCASCPPCEGVICSDGLTCDPSHQAKCNCHGVDCGPGNVCLSEDAGGCQPDLCYGVHCAGADEGIQCILGVCRCGKADGTVTVDDPVCNHIQRCQDGQCVTIVGCDSVPPCTGYELCNPQDLKCHCGTRDGPICNMDNPCVELGPDGGEFFSCSTGNDCHTVSCDGGQICDPSQSFNCVCESDPGLGGPACQQNEYCIALDPNQQPECAATCSVYVQKECQIGDAGPLNCYAELSSGVAVCETPNPLAVGSQGDPCGVNADCGPGLGCWTHAPITNNDAGAIVSTCAYYCDAPSLSMQNTMFPCVPPEYCTPVAQVQGSGPFLQIGFCQ